MLANLRARSEEMKTVSSDALGVMALDGPLGAGWARSEPVPVPAGRGRARPGHISRASPALRPRRRRSRLGLAGGLGRSQGNDQVRC